MSRRLTSSRHIAPVSGIPVRAPFAAGGEGKGGVDLRARDKGDASACSVAAAGTKRSRRIDGSRPRWFLLSTLMHLAVAAQLAYLAGDGRLSPAPVEAVYVDLVAPKQVEVAASPVRNRGRNAAPTGLAPRSSTPVRVSARNVPPPERPGSAAQVREPVPSRTSPVMATPQIAPSQGGILPLELQSTFPTAGRSEQAVPVSRPVAKAPEEGSAPRDPVLPTVLGRNVEGTQAVEADSADLRRSYLHNCRLLIERHKEYPLMARKGRLEGTVVIAAAVRRDGALLGCRIVRSSGSVLLDNAALRSVRTVAKFPPLPEGVTGDSLDFDVPVSFRLSSR